jgi:hypothetical protein
MVTRLSVSGGLVKQIFAGGGILSKITLFPIGIGAHLVDFAYCRVFLTTPIL